MTEVLKTLILGSGPAGYTAAIYAARANLAPVMIAGQQPGGQLTITSDVENYPGFPKGIMGPEMMDQFREQAERFGTKIHYAIGVEVDLKTRPFTVKDSNGGTVKAHAVIISTGATANWLGIPNELRLAQNGGGVSACAVCDGALPAFRNQPLAVVGGGDTAMEETSYLTKFASKVYVIHRRDSLRASKSMQDRVLGNPKVEMVWDSAVEDVVGQDTLQSVVVKNVKTGAKRSLEVRGLFIAIGHSPATKFLQGSGVELDEKGYVVLRSRGSQTNIEGVFAAGDLADQVYRQAITAAGMGCQAAIDCERWLAANGVH